MAEFLVLEDAQTFATPLPAGQIVDDAVFDVATLAAAGVALLAYNPATMAAALGAFLNLAEPRGPGTLLALLVAAGAIGGGSGSGDVVGPAGATDNALARFNGATGKLLQNSAVTVSDAGSIALPAGQTVDGRDVSADGALLDATAGAVSALIGDVVALDGEVTALDAALTAHIGAGGAAHAAATTSAAGFMSASDKTATDAVVAEAIRDGDFTGTFAADLTRTGASVYLPLRSNLGATVAPVSGDDNTLGYGVGSRWVDVTADRAWQCVDASTGAAIWLETAPRKRFVDDYLSGRYYPLANGDYANSLGTLTGFADRIDLYPFLPKHTLAPSELGCYVTTLVAAAEFKMLVFDSDGVRGAPLTRTYLSPAIAASAVTWLPETTGLPTFVRDRLYWIGVVHSGAAILRALPLTSTLTFGGLGTGSPPVGAIIGSCVRRVVAGAFATPPTSWGTFLNTDIANNVTPPALIALVP